MDTDNSVMKARGGEGAGGGGQKRQYGRHVIVITMKKTPIRIRLEGLRSQPEEPCIGQNWYNLGINVMN